MKVNERVLMDLDYFQELGIIMVYGSVTVNGKAPKMFIPFLKSKRVFILFIICFALFLLSIVLIVCVFPNVIRSQIYKNVRLTQGSEQYSRFLKLPFPFTFKVYFFNVENPSDILNGEKPIVREVGPYIYREYRDKTVHKTNDEAATITYTQRESFEFDYEASGNLSDNDTITTLNTALISILQTAENLGQAGPLSSCLKDIFGDLNSLFINVTVKDILFDGISFCFRHFTLLCEIPKTIACQIAKTKKNIDASKDGSLRFSMFNYKTRSDDGLYTINSGMKDIQSLGQIIRLNNSTHTKFWTRLGPNSTCDEIRGTDGSLYPPQITKETTFQVYSTDVCRYVEIGFLKEAAYKNIRGYMFGTNNQTMRSRKAEKEEDCFCAKQTLGVNGEETCFLDGVVDVQSCVGAPVLLSLPHFLWADKFYLESIQGLAPDEKKHNTFVLVEPNTGTPLQGMTRMQINAVLRPIKKVASTKNLPRVVLPLVWIEEGVSLTDEYIDKLNEEYFDKVEIVNIVKWTFLGASLVSTLIVATFLVCNRLS